MSLDYGFSKALLLRWASGSANTILLTGRGHGETTARALLKQVEDREKSAAMAAAKANVADRRAGVGGYDGEMEEGGGGEGEDEEPLTLQVKVRGGSTYVCRFAFLSFLVHWEVLGKGGREGGRSVTIPFFV